MRREDLDEVFVAADAIIAAAALQADPSALASSMRDMVAVHHAILLKLLACEEIFLEHGAEALEDIANRYLDISEMLSERRRALKPDRG